ncbi:hypothetical protein HWD94_04120 [Pseudarthrobacter equi]|uniref:hypothetical protein n=1 Tax=Pseudarthrobacter equi TaxID=728066 RepID=UPI0021BE69B4|nr:hypothetical protein [Pseudarthrobacter equi]MCT9624310.1 hypothetical protein [Pseudarthrobacter equi]
MTEQPVETEQQFLGNELRVHPEFPSAVALLDCTGGQLCTARKHLDGCYAPAFQAEAEKLVQPRQNYVPNAHRFRPAPAPKFELPDEPREYRDTNLHLEAETHAGHAVRSLENGELDAGIAWLQSALAFAQNARYSRDNNVEAGAQ